MSYSLNIIFGSSVFNYNTDQGIKKFKDLTVSVEDGKVIFKKDGALKASVKVEDFAKPGDEFVIIDAKSSFQPKRDIFYYDGTGGPRDPANFQNSHNQILDNYLKTNKLYKYRESAKGVFGRLIAALKKFDSETTLPIPDPKVKKLGEYLLQKHGLLKAKEDVNKVIHGQIVDAQQFDTSNDLVLVFLDLHKHKNIQANIVASMKELNSRGLYLLGIEGFEAKDVYSVSNPKGCKEDHKLLQSHGGYIDARILAACELGTKIFIFGTEDPALMKKAHQTKYKLSIPPGLFSGDKKKACDAIDHLENNLLRNRKRGIYMGKETASTMRLYSKKMSGLMIGLAHLNDIRKAFKETKTNYIAIAVDDLRQTSTQAVKKDKAGIKKWIEFAQMLENSDKDFVCD